MARLRCAPARVRTADTSIAKIPDKVTDEYYRSPQHRDWRRQVLERAGWRCQGPGPHDGPLHADHIIERKDGGDEGDIFNGQCLCAACHARKTSIEAEKRLLKRY